MSVRKTLCRFDAIPDGGAVAVDVESATGGFSLILLRRGSQVFAYHNECPHAGSRLDWAPGRFLIEDDSLICASHGAVFFIHNGLCHGGPCRGASLAPVPVQLVDGEIRLG